MLPPASLRSGLPTFTAMSTMSARPLTSVGVLHPPASTFSSSADPGNSWPLPEKLVRKILALEYVDMADLVPDRWQYQEEESKCCHQHKRPRRGPITDILVWIECFAFMVEILCSAHPSKVSQLMSYQRIIVRAQRTFSGEGWVTYDTCFRRKAAALKSLDWGVVDFTLSVDCVYAPESSNNPAAARPSRYPQPQDSNGRGDICNLYNSRLGNRCRFSPCRFSHYCAICRGAHPLSECRSRRQSPRPRHREARGEARSTGEIHGSSSPSAVRKRLPPQHSSRPTVGSNTDSTAVASVGAGIGTPSCHSQRGRASTMQLTQSAARCPT